MPDASPKPAKKALRAALRQTLLNFPKERRDEESAVLREILRQLPEFRQAGTVAFFCPMPFEVNLLPLLPLLLPDQEQVEENNKNGIPAAAAGKRFVFPLTHDDRSLTWHGVEDFSEMKPGRMGILEPDPVSSPAVSPDEIDLVVVPGLGFTVEGGRLGFGGGYYDRFLAKLKPGTATVAAALSCQVVPSGNLPLEAHDIPVGQVIWPR